MSNPVSAAARAFRHRYEGPNFRRFFLGGIRTIPQEWRRLSMPMWAGIFYALVPSARQIIERNLDQVEPLTGVARKRRAFRLFVNYAQAITNMYALHLGQELPVEASTLGAEHVFK